MVTLIARDEWLTNHLADVPHLSLSIDGGSSVAKKNHLLVGTLHTMSRRNGYTEASMVSIVFIKWNQIGRILYQLDRFVANYCTDASPVRCAFGSRLIKNSHLSKPRCFPQQD